MACIHIYFNGLHLGKKKKRVEFDVWLHKDRNINNLLIKITDSKFLESIFVIQFAELQCFIEVVVA